MPCKLNINNTTPYTETFRAEKVRSQFDIPQKEKLEHSIELEWSLPDTWNIGLVVGPSGSGKSTLAHNVFSNATYYDGSEALHSWPEDKSIIDGFDQKNTTSEITESLSRVGFSSPPTWLQPYHTLSTGQRFRADMARVLLDATADTVVIDEFTSTVDRTVAKSVSNAVANYTRDLDREVVLVTCHYDVADWLEPDWVADLQKMEVLQNPPFQKPEINVEIKPVDREAWEIFKDHHYLDDSLNPASYCWVGFWNDKPVTFVGVIHQPHKTTSKFKRVHRVVTLPDYQGLGIGTQVLDAVCHHHRQNGNRITIVTSHPGLLRSLNNNTKWQCINGLNRNSKHQGSRKKSMAKFTSARRKTASFEYIYGATQ